MRLLASETIITVSGNMESNLNIASVLHSLLQVLVLIYLPNIKDPVLVKIGHGDSLSLEAVLASLHHLDAIIGISTIRHKGSLLKPKLLQIIGIS